MHSLRKARLATVKLMLQYFEVSTKKETLFWEGKKKESLLMLIGLKMSWIRSLQCIIVLRCRVTLWLGKAKNQIVVAQSSAEAEFRALAHAVYELIWIKHFFKELQLIKDNPMQL